MFKNVLKNAIADQILGVPSFCNSYDYIFHLNERNGWTQWDTTRDSGDFGVWTNNVALQIFVYADGERTLILTPDQRTFDAEIERVKEHYALLPYMTEVVAHAEGGATFAFPRMPSIAGFSLV